MTKIITDRRSFLKSTTAAAALVGMPAIVRAQGASRPIKIGLLAPLTGVIAAGGKELVEGFEMYWEQVGKKVGDRAVEIVIEDDASNPDTSLQKARRLVEQGNVDFLFGNILANTGLAVANYVKGTGTPYFIPVIAADDLTQRTRIPNVIRVAGYTASQTARPLADWASSRAIARSRRSRRTTPSAMNNAAGLRRCSPSLAARSPSNSGIL